MGGTSSGTVATRRSDLTTGGPIVRFGTKWPSMTSTWMGSAPPASTAAISRGRGGETGGGVGGAGGGRSRRQGSTAPGAASLRALERDGVSGVHQEAAGRSLPDDETRWQAAGDV